MKKINKADTLLFSLRLLIYLSVVSIILVHPGIKVTFDRIGMIQWFIIIPFLSFLGFFPLKFFTENYLNRFVVSFVLLFAASIAAAGFGPALITPFLAGALSFILTYLLFYHPLWAKPAMLEPFFLAWVCIRLLAFSRSGEEIAALNLGLTQFLFVWTIIVFLFHCTIIYLCLFPNSRGGIGKEIILFTTGAAAIFVLVLVVLPPDYIRNAIIENLHPERLPEAVGDPSERGLPREASGRRGGRRTLPRSNDGRQPGLQGISEYSWQNSPSRGRNSSGEADNRQFLVKVVISEREPVYMGNSFNDRLDPVEGFIPDPALQLNLLASQRFFVTWFGNELNHDLNRRPLEVYSLSTLPQKYLPYYPVIIDPPILSEDAGPLRYIHQVVSQTHLGNPLRLVNTPSRTLESWELTPLAQSLDVPLDEADIAMFRGWLENAVARWRRSRASIIAGDNVLRNIVETREPVNEQLETILAILTGFSRYQYNLSYSDDHTIEALKEFLFESNEGDCVEFSNTAALLGRIAGIPSRVVTGYLAAEGLQTPAHLRGLSSLRARIPFLQQFPFENLYMVTNLHAHSWTQFYIADYGWLDFEATEFSIPPVGTGDFNTWDVVIPLIDQTRVFSNIRKFPWQLVLRALGFILAMALVLAYTLRYTREAILYSRVRSGGRQGARSLYLLMLSRLAADGKPIKPASKTALEYSELFPSAPSTGHSIETHFKNFALIYSELRWREYNDKNQMQVRFAELKQEYFNILNITRRTGFFNKLVRIFSLRGLAYL